MYKLLILFLYGILFFNCSTTKLNLDKTMDNLVDFTESEDYVLFTFKTDVTIKKDQEVYKPIPFEIKLPKKIKYWEAINSSNFGFYYKNNQVVFIVTDLFNEKTKNDTSFVPDKNDIKNLIRNDISTGSNKRWDIKEISILKERKNFVINKGGTSILLFNIKEKNFDNFIQLVDSYKGF